MIPIVWSQTPHTAIVSYKINKHSTTGVIIQAQAVVSAFGPCSCTCASVLRLQHEQVLSDERCWQGCLRRRAEVH